MQLPLRSTLFLIVFDTPDLPSLTRSLLPWSLWISLLPLSAPLYSPVVSSHLKWNNSLRFSSRRLSCPLLLNFLFPVSLPLLSDLTHSHGFNSHYMPKTSKSASFPFSFLTLYPNSWPDSSPWLFHSCLTLQTWPELNSSHRIAPPCVDCSSPLHRCPIWKT